MDPLYRMAGKVDNGISTIDPFEDATNKVVDMNIATTC